MPQQISPTAERGVYVIWDPIRFQRDRVRPRVFPSGLSSEFPVCGRDANEMCRGNSLSTTATSTRRSGKARNERLAPRLLRPARLPYLQGGEGPSAPWRPPVTFVQCLQ